MADLRSHGARDRNVVKTINHERVAASVSTSDAEIRRTSSGYPPVRSVGDIAGVDHPRCQQRQRQVVAAVDREVLDADRIDVIRLLHSMGLDRRSSRFAGDHDPFLRRSQRKPGRERGCIAYANLEAVDSERGEVRGLKAKRVDPRLHISEDKLARLRSLRFPADASFCVDCNDGDSGNDCSGLVVDDAANAPGIGLAGEGSSAASDYQPRHNSTECWPAYGLISEHYRFLQRAYLEILATPIATSETVGERKAALQMTVLVSRAAATGGLGVLQRIETFVGHRQAGA